MCTQPSTCGPTMTPRRISSTIAGTGSRSTLTLSGDSNATTATIATTVNETMCGSFLAVPQERCAYCTSKYSCRHGSIRRHLGSDECDVETDRQTTHRLDRSHGAAHSSVAAPTSLASEDAEGSASVPTASLLGPVTRCRCRVRPSPRPGRTSTRTSTQQRDRVLRRVRCTERCAPGCGERPEKRNSHNDCHHVPERLSPTPETDDHQIRRHDSIQRCCGRVDLPESA